MRMIPMVPRDGGTDDTYKGRNAKMLKRSGKYGPRMGGANEFEERKRKIGNGGTNE